MPRDPRDLVQRFYDDIWNRADEAAASEILHPDFRFRGSLGPERRGREGFLAYMRAIHQALGSYTCVIEDLVATENRAAARMTFQGRHQGEFFGVAATGRDIQWSGAAFFRSDGKVLTELWVLGDIDSVKQQLGAEANTAFTAD